MPKWLTALIAACAALLAWLFRDKLAQRKERELTTQRDQALVNAKQQEINAQALAQETELLTQRQRKEDAINSADNSGISNSLDTMFDN